MAGGEVEDLLPIDRGIVTWPVDLWFNGSRTFYAVLTTGGRAIESITLDPMCRFPDRDPNDNLWPAPAIPPAAGAEGLYLRVGRSPHRDYGDSAARAAMID